MSAQILVADDDPDVAALLEEFLRARHHDVLVARDGFQLSQKAAEHRPHLIIADVQMPGAYGSAVYRVLQQDPGTSRIPFLFISGHPFEKLERILPKGAGTGFLKKPFAFPDLERAIAALLPEGGFLPEARRGTATCNVSGVAVTN